MMLHNTPAGPHPANRMRPYHGGMGDPSLLTDTRQLPSQSYPRTYTRQSVSNILLLQRALTLTPPGCRAQTAIMPLMTPLPLPAALRRTHTSSIHTQGNGPACIRPLLPSLSLPPLTHTDRPSCCEHRTIPVGVCAWVPHLDVCVLCAPAPFQGLPCSLCCPSWACARRVWCFARPSLCVIVFFSASISVTCHRLVCARASRPLLFLPWHRLLALPSTQLLLVSAASRPRPPRSAQPRLPFHMVRHRPLPRPPFL